MLATMTDAQRPDVETIWAYSFDKVIERVMAENKRLTRPAVEEAVVEFRRFLTLVRLGYNNLAMTSRRVDKVWHEFILHLEDYELFCQQVFGAMLYHRPASAAEPVPAEAVANLQVAYAAVYGPMPRIWRGRGRTCGQCNCNCKCS